MKNVLNPRVAILLAAYNGEKFLKQQVESIISQENVSISVFISLDKSTDKSDEIIDGLAQINSNVHKIYHEFKEPRAGRNIFYLIKEVDFTEFDYIGFADQDDIWFSDKIYESVKKLSTSEYSAYSANVISKKINSEKSRIVYKDYTQKKWDYLFESAGPGCTYVIKKETAIKLKKQVSIKWDKIININHPDWFIYAFVKSHGENWFIDRVPRMIYIQHLNNDMGENRGYRAIIRRARMLLSKYWFQQSVTIAECLDIESSKFCKNYTGLNNKSFLFLTCNARNCRRSPFDQAIFFFACLFLTIFNFKN